MKIATSYTLLALLFMILFLLYFIKKTQLFDEKKEKNNVFPSAFITENNSQLQANAVTEYKIKNSITPAMLTYKHWTGSYQPSTFSISINGSPLQPNETRTIAGSPKKTISIRYDYSFMHGYRTGSREIEFAPHTEDSVLNLTFSWHTPAHLILENATIVQETILPFNTLLEQKQNT